MSTILEIYALAPADIAKLGYPQYTKEWANQLLPIWAEKSGSMDPVPSRSELIAALPKLRQNEPPREALHAICLRIKLTAKFITGVSVGRASHFMELIEPAKIDELIYNSKLHGESMDLPNCGYIGLNELSGLLNKIDELLPNIEDDDYMELLLEIRQAVEAVRSQGCDLVTIFG